MRKQIGLYRGKPLYSDDKEVIDELIKYSEESAEKTITTSPEISMKYIQDLIYLSQYEVTSFPKEI